MPHSAKLKPAPLGARTFIYKIHSNFDGFTPSHIPKRVRRGNLLPLVWKRYVDAVEKGDRVWVHFYGRSSFDPGVYVVGTVRTINEGRQRVILHVDRKSTGAPLSGPELSARIARMVAVRGRQVFLLRSTTTQHPFCSPERCRARQCARCPVWRRMPVIQQSAFQAPTRVRKLLKTVIPAYWVIPRRCFLSPARLKPRVLMASEIFYEFKVGRSELAYPLARGMFRAFQRRRLCRFNCIVPIPLSPNKKERGEVHRTLALARELGKLTRTPVRDLLSLDRSISKRLWLGKGRTIGSFRKRYAKLLRVRKSASKYRRILLVDDVCTHGNTLGLAATAIRQLSPDVKVAAITAGQMITKDSVAARRRLIAPH